MSVPAFKLGCDPEVFVYDTKRKHHISAHTFTPGTKANPHKVKCGAIQLDGTSIEFNIDPASTAKEFQTNVSTVLKQVRELIPEGCEMSFAPSITYPKDYWASLPDKCKELGCEPTWNAHEMRFFEAPVRPVEGFCTGAGHLHIGWTEGADITDKDHQWDCGQVINAFEYFFSRMESSYWTNDTARKALYGKKGESRVKPYGVEYRGLSNAWLKQPEEAFAWMFDTSEKLFNALLKGAHHSGIIPYVSASYPSLYNANSYKQAWLKGLK